MADRDDPNQTPEGQFLRPEVPADLPPEASIRERVEQGRNELLHKGADWLIKTGAAHPRLRLVGMRAYDLATRLIPRGREVARLGSVGPGMFRGAQPGRGGFRTLREMGVDTVINLRPESDRERDLVLRLGFRYVYLPMPPLGAPTHELTLEILHAATDPAHGVVFFHCYHGVDRTGVVAACLRIARDGWDVEQALAEMLAFGFHEHGQRAKSAYLADFHAHWSALPPAEQARVLHRPVPEAGESAPPPGIWTRVRSFLGGLARRLGGLPAGPTA
ncbi:MAG: hypothetical protein VKS61_12295 [Candidatus Sericytochromatia bacterium]|nr:hypothetical protein [Candidatus Sericytochromatia bacterium]